MTDRFSEFVPDVLEKYTAKPIETPYRGNRFRSRLEARWAVFFDTLRLKFDYEPEGYDLGDGLLYLPDFWLPQLKVWVEIKGPEPDDPECKKASLLAQQTGHRVFVFIGGITLPSQDHDPTRAHAFFPDGTGDCDFCWCECDECGQLGVEFDGRSDRLPCKEPHQAWLARKRGIDSSSGCKRISHNGDRGENVDSERLIRAYRAARAARFSR